jgi:urease accessory protein
LAAYGLAFVQNLVSAALRAAPVGQAAGTRVVAALAPRVVTLAEDAREADLDALGTATFRLDLGSFRHETQYSRIFRS